MKQQVNIKKLDDRAVIPTYGTAFSAGADLYACMDGPVTIAPGETYIDLDCSWGGVEIYVPSDWTVVFKCNAFFGGCDDKRWQNGNINKESVLVIRGTLSFGGLEVKD